MQQVNEVPPIIQPAVLPPRAQGGFKQDTFSLDEGNVILQWPDAMSQDSYEDFKSWVELQLRKIARTVK